MRRRGSRIEEISPYQEELALSDREAAERVQAAHKQLQGMLIRASEYSGPAGSPSCMTQLNLNSGQHGTSLRGMPYAFKPSEVHLQHCYVIVVEIVGLDS